MAKDKPTFVELLLGRTKEDIKEGHYEEWR
jgi:hypothetical protein